MLREKEKKKKKRERTRATFEKALAAERAGGGRPIRINHNTNCSPDISNISDVPNILDITNISEILNLSDVHVP